MKYIRDHRTGTCLHGGRPMAAGKLQGTPGTKFSAQVTDKTNGNQRICFCRLGESGKPCSLRVEEDCEAFLAEDGRVVILGQATEVCRS